MQACPSSAWASVVGAGGRTPVQRFCRPCRGFRTIFDAYPTACAVGWNPVAPAGAAKTSLLRLHSVRGGKHGAATAKCSGRGLLVPFGAARIRGSGESGSGGFGGGVCTKL